jgi:hypothetical protein
VRADVRLLVLFSPRKYARRCVSFRRERERRGYSGQAAPD